MAIGHVVTRGYGTGTFAGDIDLVPTRGYLPAVASDGTGGHLKLFVLTEPAQSSGAWTGPGKPEFYVYDTDTLALLAGPIELQTEEAFPSSPNRYGAESLAVSPAGDRIYVSYTYDNIRQVEAYEADGTYLWKVEETALATSSPNGDTGEIQTGLIADDSGVWIPFRSWEADGEPDMFAEVHNYSAAGAEVSVKTIWTSNNSDAINIMGMATLDSVIYILHAEQDWISFDVTTRLVDYPTLTTLKTFPVQTSPATYGWQGMGSAINASGDPHLYVGADTATLGNENDQWQAHSTAGAALTSFDSPELPSVDRIRWYDQLISVWLDTSDASARGPYCFVPHGYAATTNPKYITKTAHDGTIITQTATIAPDNWEIRALYSGNTVAVAADVDVPAVRRGGKSRKRYPRRIMVGGVVYWVYSEEQERNIVAKYAESLEREALTLALENKPKAVVAKARIKVVRAQRRVERLDAEVADAIERIIEEDDELIIALFH